MMNLRALFLFARVRVSVRVRVRTGVEARARQSLGFGSVHLSRELASFGKPWTPQEFAKLRELRTHKDISWAAVAEILGRSIPSVRSCWEKWGPRGQDGQLLDSRQPSYTAERSQKLLALREKTTSWEEFQAHFPGRSLGALRNTYYRHLTPQAQDCRDDAIYGQKYSQREVELLLRMNTRKHASLVEVAKKLGRTVKSVEAKWRRLVEDNATLRELESGAWSPEEDEKLIRLWNAGIDSDEIHHQLGVHRTRTSFRRRMRLHLKHRINHAERRRNRHKARREKKTRSVP